ncbi:glycoside hydrolase family 48 protein [Nocardiopsis sp. NRRL B-16309]|uniref:glycoside hydrolase family 48 protein n=1 Tax=Nocardiopsis sp. NRRL B-16309 TaxID=1519494 RepID=UPI000AD992F8|nr:glycoside hydrolase family 48 protein [Nocardiopsis sp. NRRL B-16309]
MTTHVPRPRPRRRWPIPAALGTALVAALLTAVSVQAEPAPTSDYEYTPVAERVQSENPELTQYESAFLEQYDTIKDPASGYFREFDGLLVPYHSVEKLIVEAPDTGHATTSEAYSYYLWLEATYGRVSGDWQPFNDAWASMEAFIIPATADQPTNGSYDPSAPASYIPESLSPADYPMPITPEVQPGQDPLADELSSTYGTDEIYGMHWLLDVDNIYGYGFCGDGSDDAPAYINTFQRGSNESVWETVPHPSCETFEHGGENGFLDLFVEDQSYSEQWRYTNAPDADARAVQVAYLAHEWAAEQGNASAIADSVSDASMMGDYLRYAMFDKYFKEIGDCVDPASCSPGSGKESAHYLMAWYYSWGGALESAEYPWAWRIGGSAAHQGYQNVMAAYALSEVDALRPESATGAEDWGISLDRQLEFLQWLQSSDGGIAGGATNSWEGDYSEPPAGTPTFYGMFYDEKPVWHDPPSNQWFGFQVWDIERVAEYHRITGDERAGDILDAWVPWAIENTTVGPDGEFAVPAEMEWSGAPDDWDGTPTGNPDLSVDVVSHNQDVGIAAGLAKTLMHYADATGDEASLETAEGLLDALLEHQDDLGVAVPEVRADYERFDDPFDAPDGGLYVPEGWTGQMPNGDVVDSDSTFASIRSFVEDDSDWPRVQEYLDGGPAPEFTYHRFWAQVDVATALATHGELFGGSDPDPDPSPSPSPDPTPSPSPDPTPSPDPEPDGSCEVVYDVTSEWNQGATVDVTVRNTGDADAEDWALTWSRPSGEEITGAWNAEVEQSGGTVTATPVGWNSTIAAGGQTSFGFQLTHGGQAATPEAFELDGGACSTG